MDFHCKCGAHGHLDDYFAYYVRCPDCGTVWQMPIYMLPREADPNSEPVRDLDTSL